MNLTRYLVALLVLLLTLGTVGCSKATQSTQPASQQVQKVTLTVSAAASLKDAMNEVIANYAKAHADVTITPNYGASGALEQQIENGADADIFISAAVKQIDQLKAKDLILTDTAKNLLGNQLVLVVPKESKIDLKDFQGVTGDNVKKLALGEFKSVPAGQYAEEVFKKLNILDQATKKAVFGKDVKSVLAWVESGEADAGVVYATDAKISTKAKVVAVAAEDTHSPIVYPAAVIKTSKNADAAKAFLAYLSGEQAKTVFEKYGFSVLAN